jgi:vinculin
MSDKMCAVFVWITEEQIQKHSVLCEEAIRKNQPQKMVDNTASIARYSSPHIQYLEVC